MLSSLPVKMFKFSLVIFLIWVRTSQQGCTFTLFKDFTDTIAFTTDFEILYPSVTNQPQDRNITVPPETTVIFSCNGGRFTGDYISTRTVLATCNQNSEFEVQDKILNYTTLECINYRPQVARITPSNCGPNTTIIDVGFQIGLNIKFVPQIEICFDLVNLIPIYSYFNVTKSVGFIKSYLVTLYEVDSVYNVDIDFDTVYDNFTYQQKTINNLLGLPEDSTKYVDLKTCQPFGPTGVLTPGFCFSRRALAFRGNFIYIPQQHGTYRQINVVPQWYFLDYNLDKLDRNLIDYVNSGKIDLEVFSGTLGVATLPHSVTNEETELFLHIDGNRKVLAIPKFFWRLVYDRLSLRATVFFTVNNPHLSDEEIPENVLCEDISDDMGWLTWEKYNATKGYSYACTYEDAKDVVPYLPEITVLAVLG